jgi:alpha-galactosidase
MTFRPALVLRTFFLVAFAFCLAHPAPGQSDVSGYWLLKIPNGDDTYRNVYFDLHQQGHKLTGEWLGRDPKGIPMAGAITGDKIHISTLPPPEGPSSNSYPRKPVVYDGTLHDGGMTLQFNTPRGISSGEAVRSTRESAAPPAPLPLPPLRDVGDNGLVRTPPMGWNSWNKFAGRITDADVRSMADAMVSSGMSKLGYEYINIDDTWQAGRGAQGNILTNKKFPDMKALADYVHSKGLKLGIYSSPGPQTCAGYAGSFGHEIQDAQTYAGWGIDYLKYDLCSARYIYPSNEATQRALYQKMGEALKNTNRSIVFSLCQYGESDPWKWGAEVGGNLWRTTGDIRDTWDSMDKIGFSQIEIASYNQPGHWNDPDMLEIGNGGMTADEYRTHMSLWSLLSAPLIAGNDLRSMTDETKSILMNDEVIAVDQDPIASPVQRATKEGGIEVLTRRMRDGSLIVGLFNRGNSATNAQIPWSGIAMPKSPSQIRDLWKHQAILYSNDGYRGLVPPHGVVLLRIR